MYNLNILAGLKLIVSGWGLSGPKELPKVLRRVTLPVVKRRDCEIAWRPHFPTKIKRHHICAGTGEMGICKVSISHFYFEL